MADLIVGRKASRQVSVGYRCRVVAPLMGSTPQQLSEQLKAVADQPVDLVEWRADALEDMVAFDQALDLVVSNSPVPVIATVRTKSEGGLADISADTYKIRVTRLALRADIVDVEIQTPGARDLIRAVQQSGALVMGSVHFVNGTPESTHLLNTFAREVALGADILKIAAKVNSFHDTAALLGIAAGVQHFHHPVVAIGMGKHGANTRLMGMTVGNALTFASLDQPSAPGQFSVAKTRQVLDLVSG